MQLRPSARLEGRIAASYWAATARAAPEFPRLDADIETDVAIVGAGFTGLSAAHHLQKLGRKCVVLEANHVGWGASGRNGGMVVPRYKFTYPELDSRYGRDTALLMHRLAHEAVDTVETIVRDSDLPCAFSRCGHLTPILNPIDLRRFEADVDWLAERAGDRAPRMLDARDTARKVGTSFYRGAYFEPRGGALHPLEYCRSLASSLSHRGVRIFCDTAVDAWSPAGDSVVLQAGAYRIKARAQVIATNAYTDLTPAGRLLRRRIVPVASALLATAPLGHSEISQILPEGNVATDAKRLTNYYRVMPDARFVFGGRGGASSKPSPRAYARLQRDMEEIFPMLRGVSIDNQWFGLVAVTPDSLPRVGKLAPHTFYAMGYNGRGVALAALLGSRIAQMVCERQVSLGPLTDGPFNNIPLHLFRVPAKQLAISWMQLRDAIGF